jgi:cytoskeleton-associated protein 5
LFVIIYQIDVVIKDKHKRDFLESHVDNLLNTCAVKLNVVHNVYLNNTDYQTDQCFRLIKGLFTVILDLFESGLGKHCNAKTLKDVLYNLLSVMIDSKISNLPDGDQLIKAINMVTLKVLELSEQTNSYCALVRLLIDSCGNDALSVKFMELVMKCIWRQIRRLSTTDDLVEQLDTAKVLGEIHQFFKLYPSNSWSGRVSDLPLRTIKTLLYHLAKAKKISVSHMRVIVEWTISSYFLFFKRYSTI